MAKQEEKIEYGDRETLDAELAVALGDIRSAEQEAKLIIAKAEETVKAIQLDSAARERDMKKTSGIAVSELRDKKLQLAAARAENERTALVNSAKAEGEKLVKTKAKSISERIEFLYRSLGGKA